MSHADRPLRELLEDLAARKATPGGGSAAALTGAIGASLCSMAVAYSLSSKFTDADLRGVLQSVADSLGKLRSQLTSLADADSAAYEAWRAARREGEPENLEATLGQAAEVPLEVVKLCRDGLEMVAGLVHRLRPQLITDAASGALLLRSAARSAALNVRVNAGGLRHRERATALERDVTSTLERAAELERQIEAQCEERLVASAGK